MKIRVKMEQVKENEIKNYKGEEMKMTKECQKGLITLLKIIE